MWRLRGRGCFDRGGPFAFHPCTSQCLWQSSLWSPTLTIGCPSTSFNPFWKGNAVPRGDTGHSGSLPFLDHSLFQAILTWNLVSWSSRRGVLVNRGWGILPSLRVTPKLLLWLSPYCGGTELSVLFRSPWGYLRGPHQWLHLSTIFFYLLAPVSFSSFGTDHYSLSASSLQR